MHQQNYSNCIDDHNSNIAYDRDDLYSHFVSIPTICYLCRGIVNSSLPPEQRQSFPTTQLVDFIIKTLVSQR